MVRIARSHSFYYTAFIALYTAAQSAFGRISTREFQWLKVTNRLLYMALNEKGMEKSRIESSGIHSHYLAEINKDNGYGGRITKPVINSSVLNVSEIISTEGWLTIPVAAIELDTNSHDYLKAKWVDND